jgi:hypothetical protein
MASPRLDAYGEERQGTDLLHAGASGLPVRTTVNCYLPRDDPFGNQVAWNAYADNPRLP